LSIIHLFTQILKENLSPNQLYVIYCIKYNRPVSVVNIHQEIRILVSDEWIKDESNGKGYKYALTPKADLLLDKLSFDIKDDKVPEEMKVNVLDNISQYIELFPKGKLPSGKPARADKKNLENNFKWFFANYSYTWDTVLKATAFYVDEFEKVNFMYMRTSQYFIRKKEDGNTFASELANYCSIVESGDDLDTDNHFKQNVV